MLLAATATAASLLLQLRQWPSAADFTTSSPTRQPTYPAIGPPKHCTSELVATLTQTAPMLVLQLNRTECLEEAEIGRNNISNTKNNLI